MVQRIYRISYYDVNHMLELLIYTKNMCSEIRISDK
jgi:hypothetical protein